MPITVEVVMFTYNHASFVEQALRSVLAQQTDAQLSLRIHDDASTDDTVQIIQRVLADAAIPVTLVQAAENRYSKGIAFFHEFMAQSTSQYLAILDGDDFWTDDSKLQRQVEVLERLPAAALCHHPVLEHSSGTLTAIDWPPADYRDETIQGSRLSVHNFISTSSVLLRTAMLPKAMPAGFNQLKIGDYPIWSLTCSRHEIAFVDRHMSAYRVHESNIWALLGSDEQFDQELESRIFIYSHVSQEFRNQWRRGIVAVSTNRLAADFELERAKHAAALKQAGVALANKSAQLLEAKREIRQILESRSWRMIETLRGLAGWLTPRKRTNDGRDNTHPDRVHK